MSFERFTPEFLEVLSPEVIANMRRVPGTITDILEDELNLDILTRNNILIEPSDRPERNDEPQMQMRHMVNLVGTRQVVPWRLCPTDYLNPEDQRRIYTPAPTDTTPIDPAVTDRKLYFSPLVIAILFGVPPDGHTQLGDPYTRSATIDKEVMFPVWNRPVSELLDEDDVFQANLVRAYRSRAPMMRSFITRYILTGRIDQLPEAERYKFFIFMVSIFTTPFAIMYSPPPRITVYTR